MDQPETDIVIACCRDESDIIVDFIDFYLDQGFDYICLIDNGSRDGTVQRILGHPARDRIQLRTDSRLGYDQRLLEYYDGLASLASRWVFFIDVDEFIFLPDGIKTFASMLPPDITVLEMQSVEMLPDTASEMALPLATERRQANFHDEQKVVWKRAAGVGKIFCGKHDVEVRVDRRHHEPHVFIRHFHTRSRRQFHRKLQNRIDTHEAIDPEKLKELSCFSPEDCQLWIENSKRFLEADGWELEKERLANIEWVQDAMVKSWYLSRREREKPLYTSPLIPFDGPFSSWNCFCVKYFEPSEGHTAHEHLVLLLGPTNASRMPEPDMFLGVKEVPVRIHSECLFGDVFGSGRCDCGEQLASAFREIERVGLGVIIYLRQEGRGVGLFDKIRSLKVEDPDTFARNERLGLPADARRYHLASRILKTLGVSSVRLLSGNPYKAGCLVERSIETVIEPLVHLGALSSEARKELLTKIARGYCYTPACVSNAIGRNAVEHRSKS
jgi:GTP cyclohydrolase II